MADVSPGGPDGDVEGSGENVAVGEDGATESGSGDQASGAAGRSWRVLLSTSARRAVVVFGLAGVAITQPVLDLFGRTPEFFVAGRHGGSHLVWFALGVTLVPTAAALVVLTAGQAAHPRVGAVVYSAGIGGLAFVFGLVLSNEVGIDGLWTSFVVAGALAGLVVWLERASRHVRTFLAYIALGNAAFVGMFLFTSPASQLLNPPSEDPTELAWADTPELQGPVVMLVLDELPVTTLMSADGTINRERYPNFGRLADESTWFRNASSLSPMTHQAVPSLLTGRLPEPDGLPTFEDHPQNFFTMFGDDYPVSGYESVTHLCPAELCGAGARGSMTSAFKDAGVVFGHQMLPTNLRDRLPAIDHTWGGFTGEGEGDGAASVGGGVDPAITEDDPYGRWHAIDLADTSARNQIRILDAMVAEVDETPALHLMHVAAPHYPWVLTPEGELTQTLRLDRDPPDPDHQLLAEQAYQLQSLQLGAVDRSVGKLIDQLQETGVWDDALVVVTSDHGRGMLPPPDFGRNLTDRNREELLRMPLFVKAPGQSEGEERDGAALLVDVLPSILDLLGARTEEELDGHSLFDGSSAEISPQVDRDVDTAVEIAEGHAADFPHGDDWVGLAGLGENGDLVGTGVDGHTVGSPSDLRLRFEDEAAFGDLPVEGNRWPQLLLATASGTGGERPPDLLVAVNGTLAGVMTVYEQNGDRWTMAGVTAPLFEEGANEVTAYEVERAPSGDGGVTLHPVEN